MSGLTVLRTHQHLRTLSILGPTCVQLLFDNRWQGSANRCWEEGWLWRASSKPWNFYLTHQLNRTYVDTLGGRRFGVPYIFVDGKHLSGNLDFLSASLSKCRSLTTIDIPNNAFTGRLPTNFNCKPISFGELCMMIYLNLSRDLFHGWIPGSFGNILNIEELDLSSNALFVAIPKSLTNLTYLANLNLSFNRLDGHMQGGLFSNIILKSLMGNSKKSSG